MHNRAYNWTKEYLTYEEASNYALDLGFTNVDSSVQMRRAYFALIGVSTGKRKTFCGTIKHLDRITSALELMEKRKDDEMLKANSDFDIKQYDDIKPAGMMKIEPTEVVVGSIINQYASMIDKEIITKTKKPKKQYSFEVYMPPDIQEQVNNLNLGIQHCRRVLKKVEESKKGFVVSNKYCHMTKEAIAFIEGRCEHDIQALSNKKVRMDYENILMEREDKLSAFENWVEPADVYITKKSIQKVPMIKWKHSPWKLATNKVRMDSKSRENFVKMLEMSNPKYMNYMRYNYLISKSKITEESKETVRSSQGKTKSKQSVVKYKKEIYPRLNWDELDEYLEKQKNWDTIKVHHAEDVINAAILTRDTLKEWKKIDAFSVLPNIELFTPTFFRRICQDFVMQYFTKWSFKQYRHYHYMKYQKNNDKKHR